MIVIVRTQQVHGPRDFPDGAVKRDMHAIDFLSASSLVALPISGFITFNRVYGQFYIFQIVSS